MKRLPVIVLLVWLSGCSCTNVGDTGGPDETGTGTKPMESTEQSGEESVAETSEERGARILANIRVSDFFYIELRDYMDPALRKRYLATPEADRLDRFGDTLMDFHRRQALLEANEGKLSPEEIRRYKRLEDLEACYRFLEERN